jgi:hypothetical protein
MLRFVGAFRLLGFRLRIARVLATSRLWRRCNGWVVVNLFAVWRSRPEVAAALCLVDRPL